MPNHVTNIVTFKGSEASVLALMDGLFDEKGDVDFNKFAPMPEEIKGTSSPVEVVETQMDVDKWVSEHANLIALGCGRPITKSEQRKLLNLYGADNWYDWACNHWGTKWNAYSTSRIDSNTVRFDTAWATPHPAMVKLSTKYPDVMITVRYADEDFGHNVGEYTLQSGHQINEDIPEGGSASAYKKALKIQNDNYYIDEYWAEMCDEDVDDMPDFANAVCPLMIENNILNEEWPLALLNMLRAHALVVEDYHYVAKVEELITNKKAEV